MTETTEPQAAPEAPKTIALDPVAGLFRRRAEMAENEALLLASQLRDANDLNQRLVALVQELQRKIAEHEQAAEPATKPAKTRKEGEA